MGKPLKLPRLAGKDCPIEQIAAHRKKSEKAKTFATSDKFKFVDSPVDVYGTFRWVEP